MKTVDFGAYIVLYNLVIGVLLVLASDKVASFATAVGARPGSPVERYMRTNVKTFGGSVAVL